jgi:hypothetical protein
MPPRLETAAVRPGRDLAAGLARPGGRLAAGAAGRAGWGRAGQGPPQDPVLGEDVHHGAVQADPDALPGQRGADLDDLIAQRDDPGGVDQPVHFHAPTRGQGAGERPRRRGACQAGTGAAQPRQVHLGQPGGTVLTRHPPMLR